MTEPTPSPPQMSRQAVADSHNFRQRATSRGDLLDIILALEKRVARLEAQLQTH
jgi:hypothetical protein